MRWRLRAILYVALVALALALSGQQAVASEVPCGTAGDGAGWAIAANGDFDGDGTSDLAVGAPCARVGKLKLAGRVVVYSGASGQRLRVLRGTASGQKFGGALTFSGDVDGDGSAELIIGSPGWQVTATGGQIRAAAGKVELYSYAGGKLLTKEGTYGSGNLGEAVAALSDLDGDAVPDFVVGAGGDRAVQGGDRFGAAYLISGASGQVLDTSLGELRGDQWGAIVSTGSDLDEDGIQDVMIASSTADKFVDSTVLEEDNGLVRIVSGVDFSQVIVEARGQPEEKLGRSTEMLGRVDEDALDDFVAGSPGVTVGTSLGAGSVSVLSGWDGSALRILTEPAPQVGASFGTAVAPLGYIDDDDVPDLVASAPAARVGGLSSVGRLHAFSAADGSLLWSSEGSRAEARYGQSLVAMPDWDGDGFGDVGVGSPGDVYRGRRGAGTVRILSGRDGHELKSFGGWRGRETRLFIASWGLGGMPEVLSVAGIGRSSRSLGRVLRGAESGSLSIAVVDDGAADDPSEMKLAVAGRTVSSDARVEVLPANGRGGLRSGFQVEFGAGFSGGVNLAAGDLLPSPDEEIVVVQADGTDGRVDVSVYSRVDIDPYGHITWGKQSTFSAFTANEIVDGFPVNTDGATVAVGSVIAAGDAIVVGAASGTAFVRVLDATGKIRADWLAYPPQTYDGTSVAVANLDGGGTAEIITVPYSGQLRVRAFDSAGTPFVSPTTGTVVDFVVPLSVTGSATGFRVAVADIDLDDKGEILVIPDVVSSPRIFAFELDGTLVPDWPASTFPYRPLADWPVAIAATDRFERP